MAKKTKKMRYWNGRDHFGAQASKFHGYVCAYSKAEAARLCKQLWRFFTVRELNEYWAECWGNAANEILGEQTEPGLFISYDEGDVHIFKYKGTHDRYAR